MYSDFNNYPQLVIAIDWPDRIALVFAFTTS